MGEDFRIPQCFICKHRFSITVDKSKCQNMEKDKFKIKVKGDKDYMSLSTNHSYFNPHFIDDCTGFRSIGIGNKEYQKEMNRNEEI